MGLPCNKLQWIFLRWLRAKTRLLQHLLQVSLRYLKKISEIDAWAKTLLKREESANMGD